MCKEYLRKSWPWLLVLTQIISKYTCQQRIEAHKSLDYIKKNHVITVEKPGCQQFIQLIKLNIYSKYSD